MGVENQLSGLVASSGVIPYYREVIIPLAANGDYTLNAVGDAVNVIDLTGACSIAINDGNATPARAGIGYKLPAGALFNRIRVKETAGGAASVTLGVAYGEIQDNRASFAGDQTVKNAAVPNDELFVKTKVGTTLAAALAAADPGLAALASSIKGSNTLTDLKTSIDALLASTGLRARYIDLTGASFAIQSGTGTNTVVTAGTNTNGILLLLASTFSTNGGNRVAIGSGPFTVLGTQGATAFSANQPHPVFISAGLQLQLIGDSASDESWCWYKVL